MMYQSSERGEGGTSQSAGRILDIRQLPPRGNKHGGRDGRVLVEDGRIDEAFDALRHGRLWTPGLVLVNIPEPGGDVWRGAPCQQLGSCQTNCR